MEIVFKQILKQSAKITRILTRVTDSHPKLSQELDLALYAALKIEKTINKFMNGMSTRDVMQFSPIHPSITHLPNSQDALFDAAMQNIQNFKNSAFKLERKINVLISQAQPKAPKSKKSMQRQINTDKPRSLKATKAAHKYVESRQEREEESESHLSDIDASIIKLTREIKKVMREEQGDDSYSLSRQTSGFPASHN